ncbi:F-box protein SKIP23-like [Prunus avium]|uniref:F-box protein SKIP23-like n=1 Tax=Prunus avium TaxID=42229 RepID=A0A6P5U1N0_PRUAV|nr:F-box protein SKIP23-like [Prunus avium]
MGSDWAELCNQILDLVLEKLVSSSDYLRFSLVCKSWHSAAKDYQRSGNLSTCHPPMLLISTGKNGIWRLYNIMDDKVLDLQLNLSNKRFCGSSKGWLIAVDQSRIVTLINPFVRVKGRRMKKNSIIRLPPLTPPSPNIRDEMLAWAPYSNYFIFKAMLSADPILDANNCIVLVIYEQQCQMAFIRLNKDTTWTYVDQRYSIIEEVVLHQHKVYAASDRSFVSFDITTRSLSNVKFVAQCFRSGDWMKTYLVDSNDEELLMVERKIELEEERVTRKFKIFKFDYKECKWIVKKSLGDVAIFLGDNSSISVSASKFPECQPNCIYFTHDNISVGAELGPRGPCDIGVYDVASKKISQPSKDVMTLVKKSRQPPIWIVPRIQL